VIFLTYFLIFQRDTLTSAKQLQALCLKGPMNMVVLVPAN